ncbi:MAG: PTS sugar transporter subunit IIA [Ignavibacteriales bacterium]
MSLVSLLDRDLCFARLRIGTDESVLRYLSAALLARGYVENGFEQALLKREREFPTALPTDGLKVAIPHTDSEHVRKSAVAVASVDPPVSFHVMGNPEEILPVSVVFLLVIKDRDRQVEILRELVGGVIRIPSLVEKVFDATTGHDIYEVMIQGLECDSRT